MSGVQSALRLLQQDMVAMGKALQRSIHSARACVPCVAGRRRPAKHAWPSAPYLDVRCAEAAPHHALHRLRSPQYQAHWQRESIRQVVLRMESSKGPTQTPKLLLRPALSRATRARGPG